jgi:6-pyruvoyltetrahydropterin/6-carboxytetrahydropterin synthase
LDAQRYVFATAGFEAARKVEILPEGHRSRRLHGHSFLAKALAVMPDNWCEHPGDEADYLKRKLEDCIQQLDYSFLNDELPVPTDENLSRWVRSRIPNVPGIEYVGVQSTGDTGADLDELNQAHIWRRYHFEAAHQLPNVPDGHKCGRMHGHGFMVTLHAKQSLDGEDMGVDYDRMDAVWAPMRECLDHRCLNDIEGLENPTSEMLSRWLWEQLKSELPELACVSVYETTTAGAHYDGEQFRIWKDTTFESALRLTSLPEDDPRFGLHGHSYMTRLHIGAPLDEVMGWTIDYGDVKEIFKPVFLDLDHWDLTEVEGLESPNTLSLAAYVAAKVREQLPQLDRLDISSTQGCGGGVRWGASSPVEAF